jgi:hypothetical protein
VEFHLLYSVVVVVFEVFPPRRPKRLPPEDLVVVEYPMEVQSFISDLDMRNVYVVCWPET